MVKLLIIHSYNKFDKKIDNKLTKKFNLKRQLNILKVINTLLKTICFGPLGSYQIQENGKAISDFSFRTAFKVVENVSKKY